MDSTSRRYPVYISVDPNDKKTAVGRLNTSGPIIPIVGDRFAQLKFIDGRQGFNPSIDEILAVNDKIRNLYQTSTCNQLRNITASLIGYQCFSLGVIANIGKEIIDSASEIYQLMRTIVLAEFTILQYGK